MALARKKRENEDKEGKDGKEEENISLNPLPNGSSEGDNAASKSVE